MKRSRLTLAPLLGLAFLLFAVEPVAAQASVTSELINGLNNKLLWVAVPITVLVEGILLYTVWRFKDADEAKPTQENRRLEITWTIATAVILLFVGVASYGVLANENVTFQNEKNAVAPEDGDVVVRAEAFQWGWRMSYPKEEIQPGRTVVIPKGEDVYFNITSTDVIHSFHVPKLGLKQDAMPGQVYTIKTVALEEGTYQGYCAEFCGVAHSQMMFKIKVVSQQEYQQWLSEQKSGSADIEASEQADAAIAAN